MPRITRKQQKVFAVNASNNGVFGSLQANDPVYSQDPDAIQGRTAYENGWNDATYSAEQLPPLEEFQSLQYLFSRQIAYLMQDGIPEWNSATTYYKGALVKAIQGDGSFILYASLIDNNTGNQVTDTTKWVITNTSNNFHQGIPNWRADVIYSDGDWVKSEVGGIWTIFESLQNNNLNNAVSDSDYWVKKPFGLGLPLFVHTWADHELNDIEWLRADTFSWQDGTFYVAAYNHLVEDYNTTTSQWTTEQIGSYTIWYIQANDGHKIVFPESETVVNNIYNESGVAWYYILDTANQRFKLPRTKHGFTGLRDTVGKYVDAGLPNITHTHERGTMNITGNISDMSSNSEGSSTYTGAFKKNSGGYGSGHAGVEYRQGTNNVSFDASLSWTGATSNNSAVSSIYGNSSTVQPPATQMYLYFYVGNYTQTAIEQTAGLNAELFNGKVDLDGGNVIANGGPNLRNISKWSSNTTNCITEIPQDINLTLSSGTLTLKAGSKVYVPNGSGVFDTVNITTDKTVSSTSASNGKHLLVIDSGGALAPAFTDISGPTEPSTPTNGMTWYDTTNNVIKRYWGGTWFSNFSLPFAIITVSNGAFSSIDQVFNGFGYIGSTVFALPGVKGLIPNGRNADGTLKSIEFTVSSVLTNQNTGSNRNGTYIQYYNGVLTLNRVDKNAYYYNEQENQYRKISDNTITERILVANTVGDISSFSSSSAFHALDYNDKGTIAGWGMPSDTYIDYSTSDRSFTAPANGYYNAIASMGTNSNLKWTNTSNGMVSNYMNSQVDTRDMGVFIPVKKGDSITLEVVNVTSVKKIRFIYLQGEI